MSTLSSSDFEAVTSSLARLPISLADKQIMEDSGQLPIAAKVALLAQEAPDEVALCFCRRDRSEVSLTWSDFDRATNRVARLFESFGLTSNDTVVVALPNCIDHFVATFAAWKLGAMVALLDPSSSSHQTTAVLSQLPSLTVVVTDSGRLQDGANGRKLTRVCSTEHLRSCEFSSDPIEIVTPNPGLAVTSGGSTGAPRIIVKQVPLTVSVRGVVEIYPLRGNEYVGLGVRPDHVQLVAGPLFHGGPFVSGALVGIASGQTVVLMERFEAELAISLIERHRVNFVFLVPTMMRRILQINGIQRRDFSSIKTLYHGAAICSQDVKRGWIDLVGPEHIIEGYGASEGVGSCVISGKEWLEHPGSVGLPVGCEIVIIDEDGQICSGMQVGEIFMRAKDSDGPASACEPLACAQNNFREIAAEIGFRSVGDLGYLDNDGYLFIADRRADLIISGGANVYPAEVEAVLSLHPAIRDVAVIGISDQDLGKRVHAIIERNPDLAICAQDLVEFCFDKLEREKQPRSYQFVDHLPRSESGKLRRNALAVSMN